MSNNSSNSGDIASRFEKGRKIMTQEEKQLLLITLCGMLPYGVKINIRNDYTFSMEDMELNAYHLASASYDIEYRGLRPYLRPMSSMTEEEEIYYNTIYTTLKFYEKEDWLNAHHFDYRIDPSTGKTLIESNLAIEAPKDMYKTE